MCSLILCSFIKWEDWRISKEDEYIWLRSTTGKGWSQKSSPGPPDFTALIPDLDTAIPESGQHTKGSQAARIFFFFFFFCKGWESRDSYLPRRRALVRAFLFGRWAQQTLLCELPKFHIRGSKSPDKLSPPGQQYISLSRYFSWPFALWPRTLRLTPSSNIASTQGWAERSGHRGQLTMWHPFASQISNNKMFTPFAACS